MKPLDLRIHEKHPSTDAYRFGPSYTPYAIVAVDKRLTDAELAAEFEASRCDAMLALATGSYWCPLGETWPTDTDSAHNRTMTLLRFATLQHYDEDDQ